MASAVATPPAGQAPGGTRARLFGRFAKAAAGAAFAVAAFPFLLPMPWGEGLEWSWQMALHESVARRLVYGRDFTFTYGPLGFLANPYDMGGLAVTAARWRLAVHALFCLAVGLNVWSCRSALLAWAMAATIALSQVQWDLPSVILLSELAFLWACLVRGVFWPAVPAAFLAAVGLLVKFNFGVAGVLSLVVWSATVAAGPQRRRLARWAVPLVAVFLTSLVGLFRAYGGPPGALPDFLRGSWRLAAGYSAQMSLAGEASEVWTALAAVAVVLVAVAAGSYRDRRYATLALLLALPVCVLFKSAFVRQDALHVILFVRGLPALAALFLVLPATRAQTTAAVALAVLVSAGAARERYLVARVFHADPDAAYLTWGHQNLVGAWHWSQARRLIDVQMSRPARAAMRLPPAVRAYVGPAPIDAYPWEASVLFANGLNWSPRPVFQSYSAYTPELDEANAAYYRSDAGPRFILYRHQAIDDLFPWFVDPLTLREVYRRYDVARRAGKSLLLQRRVRPRDGPPLPIGTATVRLGESVAVPDDGPGLVYAALCFRLTRAGAVRDKLWKVYAPSLQLHLADGSTRTHRIVWRNAVNGLPISELPTRPDDDLALWDGSRRTRVESFTVLADPADFDERVEITWLKSAPKDAKAAR
jgi:hypothetical protein